MTATSSRAAILDRIKNSLAPHSEIETRKSSVSKRISSHETGIIPTDGSMKKKSKSALFREKVLASAATIKMVKNRKNVASAVSAYLRDHNLPAEFKCGHDPRINALGWPAKGGPIIQRGTSTGEDAVTLSHADAAVAETGTLVLTSGPHNPTRLNFLPETHIVVLNSKDLRRSQESVWKTFRRKFGATKLPRTLNLITGPSRSADIEQTLILGAHGPLRLHVIVIDEAS